MPRRLLGYDPLTGVKTFHEYDWKDRKTVISYEQDVQKVLDRAHAMQTDGVFQSRQKKTPFWHAATIPDILIIKWRGEGIDVYNPAHYDRLRKKLNDPEYAYLRTWKGRI